MKARIKRIIYYCLIGMGIGSFVYLINLSFYAQTTISNKEIIITLLMSGSIGLLSLIFTTQWGSYGAQMLIHYMGTTGLVLISGLFNHWITNIWTYLVWITVIYIIIWAVQYYLNRRAADNINQLVKKRKSAHR